MPNDPFAHDQFTLRRKVFKLFGAAFHLYDPAGHLVGYSKQKAFKLREDIRLYASQDMSDELLTIGTGGILDFSATYTVTDARTGQAVGALRREGMKSMLRDSWLLLDAGGREIGTIKEESGMLGLVRRFVDVAALLLPQTFVGEVNGAQVMQIKQNYNPIVQKVTIDLRYDTANVLDRRLALGAAILILAIEGKQD